MNKIAAILLLAAVAVQAKFIPEVQDAIVRYPELIKSMKSNVDAMSRNVALPDTKIIGGTPATPGQFPYQCHLTLRATLGSYFCGCSILSDTWILTAAHCPDGINSISVYLGDTDRNVAEPNEQTIAASSWTLHENWRPNLITNDIAVIKLSQPATLGSTVASICLAEGTDAEEAYDGQVARVSGWGKDSDTGSVTTKLNYVDVTVLDYATCNAAFPLAYSRSNVCTSTAGNHGTCNGDSGGPLVLTIGGKLRQIGIVSFGSGSGCTREPSVFTRVSSFRSWVETHIQGATIC